MCGFSALLAVLLLLCFLHGRTPLRHDLLLDTEVVGQYGDFIGGVIGTLVSAVLLYFTFKLQREDSESNSLVYKKSQLNESFYKLIDQYQNIISRISYDNDDTYLVGKEALHHKYADLQEGFKSHNNTSLNRKNAIASYLEFYSFNRDYMPTLFRIMYRICDIVNTADDDLEDYKAILIKVFRAQLNDSELCLLRYNAMTLMGKKFAPLINKYNLIKHLPPLELLEYTYWRKKMTLEEQNSTNIILIATKRNIQLTLEKGFNVESFTNDPRLYNINVNPSKNRSELRLCLFINPNKTPQKYDLIHGIFQLSHDDRLSLFLMFLKDCILLSTFMLNNPRELEWKSSKSESEGKYHISVTNIKDKPLRLILN